METWRKSAVVTTVLGVFLVGAVAGAWAAKKGILGPELFTGKSTKDAGQALLGAAETIAARQGTWERIALGRVKYLSGDKAGGQAIFDQVLAGKKVEAGDWFRIGKVYYEAGEWAKAKPAFDKVVELDAKDEDWMAQIGAMNLLKGDRTKAEELFTRSFALDSDNLYNDLRAAGAYLGVEPN